MDKTGAGWYGSRHVDGWLRVGKKEEGKRDGRALLYREDVSPGIE